MQETNAKCKAHQMLVVRDTAKFVERPNHNELKPRLKNDGVCCVFVRLRLVS